MAPIPQPESLTSQTARGVAWSSVAQLLTQAIQFGVTVLLARLLTTTDFGLLAYATLVVGFLSLANELGLGAALVQRRELSAAQCDSAFWLTTGMALALWGVAVLVAPALAAFFQAPMLVAVLRVMGGGFVLGALATVPRALLERGLRFRALSVAEMAASLLAGVVALGMAWEGQGVWALVVWAVLRNGLLTVALFLAARWRPALRFEREALRGLFGFGAKVVGVRFINYWAANIDNLVVGRLLGPAALGVYSVAYNLIALPQTRLVPQVTRVLFSAFVQVQDDDARLRRGYLKTVTVIALLVAPMMAGLFLVAPTFVTVVYTDRWAEAVPAIRLLAPVGLFYSLGSTVGAIFLAKGRPDLELRLTLMRVALLSSFVLVGVRWGIPGVAAGVLTYGLTAFWLFQVVANRLIGLPMRDYALAWRPALLATAGMSVALLGWQWLTAPLGLAPAMDLLLTVAFGGLCYLLALRRLRDGTVNELLGVGEQALMRPLRQRWARMGRGL